MQREQDEAWYCSIRIFRYIGFTFFPAMSTQRNRIGSRAMTFRGVCFVGVISAIAAGLGLGGYLLVSRRAYNSKLRAELPRFCRALTEQRDRLKTAILAYRKAMGFYPPDHVLGTTGSRVDPITNQLFYELVGCGYDPTQRVYVPSIGSMHLSQALIRQFFGRDIVNRTEDPGLPKCFLPSARTEPLLEIHDKPDSIALLSYWPDWEDFDGDLSGFQIGTWQYNSSAPQHNPGAYDLWLELKAPGTNIVIGNW